MSESENKAYKLFLKNFPDTDFASAWLAKHKQHMEIGTATLIDDGYQHYVRVKVDGKFCSFYGMPSNISLTGGSSGEETIIVQWFTDNPEWTWENQVEPQCTFHRKDKFWTRKV